MMIEKRPHKGKRGFGKEARFLWYVSRHGQFESLLFCKVFIGSSWNGKGGVKGLKSFENQLEGGVQCNRERPQMGKDKPRRQGKNAGTKEKDGSPKGRSPRLIRTCWKKAIGQDQPTKLSERLSDGNNKLDGYLPAG